MNDAPTDRSFTLHPRLAADTHLIGDLPLCRVLLMNDARFPWLILVPRRAGLHELADLAIADSAALMDEVRLSSRALRDLHSSDRVNVAAIGNIVDQLHIHVVSRATTDAAWPGPVWGQGSVTAYDQALLFRRRKDLLKRLNFAQ